MTMIVFAIKQLSTGYYLPSRQSTRGFTHDTPTPANQCLPRLFYTKHAAACALRAWLDGPWEDDCEYDEWGGGWVKVGSRPNRHKVRAQLKNDMVVVPMTLTEGEQELQR